mgnify:CR=1 FL=1
MKLNKKLLKSIVKECLVEILAEGLVQSNGSSVDKREELKESVGSAASRNFVQKRSLNNAVMSNERYADPPRPAYLDNISYGQSRAANPPEDRVQRLVSKVSNDPIMREIFADTAASTLQEQRESGNKTVMPSKPADQAARIVAETDPTDLFGASAGKWADLAFAPKISG